MRPTGTLLRTVSGDRRPGEARSDPERPPARAGRTVAGIRIEKDVSLPSARGHDSPIVRAILALEIGESFAHGRGLRHSVKSKAVRRSKRRFTVRRIDNDTYRVWRIPE